MPRGVQANRRGRGTDRGRRARARPPRIGGEEEGDGGDEAEGEEGEVVEINSGEQRNVVGGEDEETDNEEEVLWDRVDISDGEAKKEESSCSGRLSGEEVDSSSLPNCPICMERWTHGGIHRVCCIPCGHVYGRSCLEKWIRHCGRNFVKCPQCNRKFKEKQIINLYAPQIAVASEDLEKEIRCLREKNESLNHEKNLLLEEVRKHKMHIMEMEHSERCKKACLDHVLLGEVQRRSNNFTDTQQSLLHNFSEPCVVSQNHILGESLRCSFVLKTELELDEARVLDIDASSQISLISSSTPGLGGEHIITKISLLDPHEMENILLPLYTGAIRDLRIAPSNTSLPGRLALLASLGKKLSIFSTESNNIVLKYDLPAPAWSCSWDVNSPDLIYAGLQNGMLLVFDIRQTAGPLRSNSGLSAHPVHTIHSVVSNDANNATKLLTASSVGPCFWEGNAVAERPFLLPEVENHGVCISLACGSRSEDIVASFRPKVDVSNDSMGSQSSQSHSPALTGPGKWGSHVLFKRSGNNWKATTRGFGHVSEVRMSRSAIIPVEGSNPLFAYGDEKFQDLCVWDIPSLQVVRRLKPHQHPILDVRYSRSAGPGLLSCISKNRLQLFNCLEH